MLTTETLLGAAVVGALPSQQSARDASGSISRPLLLPNSRCL
jgi:hypothetical protein